MTRGDLLKHPRADRLTRVCIGLDFQPGAKLGRCDMRIPAWLDGPCVGPVIRPSPAHPSIPSVAQRVVAHPLPTRRRGGVLTSGTQFDHRNQHVQMHGTVAVPMLDHEPGVLIRLQSRKRDTLQVVDVLSDLFVGRRVVNMPTDDRAGVFVLAVDAVNEALDLQRVAASYAHTGALRAGRIVGGEQVLHCTLTAARCLTRFAPLEVHDQLSAGCVSSRRCRSISDSTRRTSTASAGRPASAPRLQIRAT